MCEPTMIGLGLSALASNVQQNRQQAAMRGAADRAERQAREADQRAALLRDEEEKRAREDAEKATRRMRYEDSAKQRRRSGVNDLRLFDGDMAPKGGAPGLVASTAPPTLGL